MYSIPAPFDEAFLLFGFFHSHEFTEKPPSFSRVKSIIWFLTVFLNPYEPKPRIVFWGVKKRGFFL